MDFYDLWETSLGALFANSLEAFPNSAKKHNALQTVVIKKLVWLPYVGVKTLFVKGLAENVEEHTENRPVVVFKGVNYVPLTGDPVADTMAISMAKHAGKQLVYLGWNDKGVDRRAVFERLSEDGNDVVVMCSCGDYRWRLHWWNWRDGSHFGSKPKKYVKKTDKPPVNPGAGGAGPLPGICKHIMKLAQVLRQSKLYG